jgi:hypothetical protein
VRDGDARLRSPRHRASVLGAAVTVALAVSAVAYAARPATTAGVPDAAVVAPRPVPAPAAIAVPADPSVTVVVPRRPIEVYDAPDAGTGRPPVPAGGAPGEAPDPGDGRSGAPYPAGTVPTGAGTGGAPTVPAGGGAAPPGGGGGAGAGPGAPTATTTSSVPSSGTGDDGTDDGSDDTVGGQPGTGRGGDSSTTAPPADEPVDHAVPGTEADR